MSLELTPEGQRAYAILRSAQEDLAGRAAEAQQRMDSLGPAAVGPRAARHRARCRTRARLLPGWDSRRAGKDPGRPLIYQPRPTIELPASKAMG